jgi:hypothetical protein
MVGPTLTNPWQDQQRFRILETTTRTADQGWFETLYIEIIFFVFDKMPVSKVSENIFNNKGK